MNKIIILTFILLFLILAWPGGGCCGPIDELVNEFDVKIESLKPLPNSSLNADYKQAQIALGTIYTIKALKLLYNQNQDLINQNDEIKNKHDEIIKQNKEIIRLLSIIAKKETKANRMPSIFIPENKKEKLTPTK
ncbi:MAG: hypothetical protein JJW03_04775 [Desulfosarcina sp.]|nr:hypothetical protein [Desulfobacterales bacterium]